VQPRGRGVAVALNGEVVPRGAWDERRVSDGDHIEALTAIQGG
jgi:sulfur carrier protein